MTNKRSPKVVPIRPLQGGTPTPIDLQLAALGLALTAEELVKIADDLVARGVCQWRLKDDKAQNISMVQAVSDLPRLVVEPADNCNDARARLARLRAVRDGYADPKSPVEIAERLFGVPEGRPELLNRKGFDKVASGVQVTMFDGSRPAIYATDRGGRESMVHHQPNIAFRDYGTGVSPEEIRTKVLSAAAGDKIDDVCSSGSWGVGASFTLSASDAALIVSRRQPELLSPEESDVVGLTVCVKRQTPTHKLPAYQLLVRPDGTIPVVPVSVAREWNLYDVCMDMQAVARARGEAHYRFQKEMTEAERRPWKDAKDYARRTAAIPRAEKLNRPEDFDCRWFPHGKQPDRERDTKPFAAGTLVVHYNFRVGPYKRHIWDQHTNLRTLLDVLFGDLHLPFRLFDLTEEHVPARHMRRSKIVRGLRSRLAGNAMYPEEGHEKRTVDYCVERLLLDATIPMPDGGQVSEKLEASYFVVKRAKPGSGYEPRESYAPPAYSVLFTLDGRTVHAEASDFFQRTHGPRLGVLRNHLLVVVRLDPMTREWRQTILQSTRERFVGGPVQQAIFTAVLKALAADERLQELDAEWCVEALRLGGAKNKYQNDKGIKNLLDAVQMRGEFARDRAQHPRNETLKPLPTIETGPSWVNIDSELPLRFNPGKNVRVRFSSDAPDGVVPDVTVLTLKRVGESVIPRPFEGGRSIATIGVARNATPGEDLVCTIHLTFPNGRKFEFECPFVVTAPNPSGKTGGDTEQITKVKPVYPVIVEAATKPEVFAAYQWDWDKRDETLYRIIPMAPPKIKQPVVVVHTGYGLLNNTLATMARVKRLSARQIEIQRKRFVNDIGSAIYVDYICRAEEGDREDLTAREQRAHVLSFLQSSGLVADRKSERSVSEPVSVIEPSRSDNEDDENDVDDADEANAVGANDDDDDDDDNEVKAESQS